MDEGLLEILRCPFCGGRLRLARHGLRELPSGAVEHGTLSCACCAYPVVAGIPYLHDDDVAQTALHHLDEGDMEDALFALLGLEGEAREQVLGLLRGDSTLTFREAVPRVCRRARTYFLYRFSDPTFLAAQALVRALAQDRACFAGPVLDLGGGTGHLTRTLCRLSGGGPVVLANKSFEELWLARRYLAPASRPVCCDANKPLPFARDTFSLVVCSDAFHYVWCRRLLADEAVRLIGDRGAILLTHLHNALCENDSAGMPLAPGEYRSLFETLPARLFKESAVSQRLFARRPFDLAAGCTDEELSEEPALVLLASRRPNVFRLYEYTQEEPARPLAVNPLYQRTDDGKWLELRLPSPEFASEYARYGLHLPERVEGTEAELAERYVLLELPEYYV